MLDPAEEIGDTISVSGELTSLLSCDLTFDSLCAASVSAPEDEELDHEYPYTSAQERSYSRKLQHVQSELTLQAQQIAARVTRTGGEPSLPRRERVFLKPQVCDVGAMQRGDELIRSL